PAMPNVTFVLCGGVCDEPSLHVDLPSNVRLAGTVSDAQKLRCLHAADIALNPMFSGSGTNIKMFDFMAAGLAVVATKTGSRGICDVTRRGVTVCTPDEFARATSRLLADPRLLDRAG